jgi:NAD(P)-dependent dehydrogenase (short-subunit alcohol dehydrogenase family)
MKAETMFSVAGRVALVTGASSGLGARFARVLAANGARVVCVARRVDRLAALVKEIEAAGGQALAIGADVSDRAAMTAAFDAAGKAFGTVTILVNNAGIGLAGRVTDQPESIWRDTMSVNLDAVYFNAQEAAQRMIAAGKPGAIVNIASILGFGVGKGLSAYAVSKAAVVQLTKALAIELGRAKIRVNALAPGYFVTEINADHLARHGEAMKKDVPLGHFGAEGDLDGPLLLLASEAGAFIHGATYVVDGGQMIGLRGS